MDRVKFSELNISEEILRAIEDVGYEEATPIQTKTIPLIMEGRDVIGHSHTGTGKTAAFGIPALELIDPNDKSVQVLVLCPTRELAMQACEEVKKFTKYLGGIKVLPIYGGQQIDRQIKRLKQGVQLVIGTPGRIMDHMRRRTLKTGDLKMLILDEADEMLNMGFREDIETILKDVPNERQTILFSATMSKAILSITKNYQKDPQLVKVVHKQLTVPNVNQYYYEVNQKKKIDVLCRIIDLSDPKLALVFCNTKKKVDEVVSELQLKGYLAEGIHGDIKQSGRSRVMDMFRKGAIDILVATDVAARGIDVDDIEAVFNFDVPQDEEYYVHRIGRTGRAGRSGNAYTFVSGRKQMYALRDIQKYTNTKIKLNKAPTHDEVEEKKLSIFVDDIKNEIETSNLAKYTRIIEQLMDDDLNSVDIASALLKISFSEKKEESVQPEYDFGDTGGEPGMARLFLNVGKKDNIRPGDIVGAIAGETGIKGKVIGSIDVFDAYTFVEVPKSDANEVLEVMNRSKIKGKSVNVEPARSKR